MSDAELMKQQSAAMKKKFGGMGKKKGPLGAVGKVYKSGERSRGAVCGRVCVHVPGVGGG